MSDEIDKKFKEIKLWLESQAAIHFFFENDKDLEEFLKIYDYLNWLTYHLRCSWLLNKSLVEKLKNEEADPVYKITQEELRNPEIRILVIKIERLKNGYV